VQNLPAPVPLYKMTATKQTKRVLGCRVLIDAKLFCNLIQRYVRSRSEQFHNLNTPMVRKSLGNLLSAPEDLSVRLCHTQRSPVLYDTLGNVG